MFYVYKTSRRKYPHNWEFVSSFDRVEDAEKAAIDLCPKGQDITKESGFGTDNAFFGSALSDKWSAMILDHMDENYR